MRRALITAGAVLALGTLPAAADWPERPIEISVFAAAGGGTDLINRTIAAVMEPELGATVNVVNRTGGGGAVAVLHVLGQPTDGYSWAGISESMLPLPVLGAVDATAEDWHLFMVAGAPNVISVPADSPYETIDDLIEAARENPGGLRAGASITGSIHHTLLVALERAADIEVNFIPFEGSHPSQVAAVAGEVELVNTSVSEQAELIRGGQLRPLAMVGMEPYEFPGVGTIPALGDDYPAIADVPVFQWLGFGLVRGVPEEVVEKVTAAFVAAMETDAVRDLAESRFLTLYGHHGAEADEVARNMERAWTWLLHDIGIAQRSPDEVGIEKP